MVDHVLKRRCAIYTRKSSEEGLDQAYNSLDAQRDAFIARPIPRLRVGPKDGAHVKGARQWGAGCVKIAMNNNGSHCRSMISLRSSVALRVIVRVVDSQSTSQSGVVFKWQAVQ